MREELELIAGLRPEDIDSRLRLALRREHLSRREQAYYLAEIERSRSYLKLGYPSTRTYATLSLEMKPHQVRDLLIAGRALRTLPLIDQAFAEDRINWSRTRLLARICIPQTQEAWLERALSRSIRELEEEVARSQKGRLPGEGLALPPLRYRLSVNLDPRTQKLWERAQNLIDERRSATCSPCEVLHEILSAFLETSELRPRSDPPAREQGSGLQSQKDQSQPGGDPQRPLQDPAGPTSAHLRRAVLARDQRRCCHCGGEHHLQVHHIEWRCAGGATRRGNLLALCSSCHRLVHERLLQISGSPGQGWIFHHPNLSKRSAADPAPLPSTTPETRHIVTGAAAGRAMLQG